MSAIYMSTDPGAPQLSGQPGSLVAVLDAVLVDGYGVGSSQKAPAGWTKPLAAQNRRSYRNDPVKGTGFFLEVNDTGQVGNAGFAWVRGYSSMSDFGEGQRPTPTVQARANGVVVAKSSTINSLSRPWIIIADARFFYLFVNPWSPGGDRHPYFFGDFISYKPADSLNWCVCVNGLTTFSGSVDIDQTIFTTFNTIANIDTSRPALFLPSTQRMPAVGEAAYMLGGYRGGGYQAWGGLGTVNGPYPSPITQGLIYSEVQIFEAVGSPRGRLPGIIAPMHQVPFVDLERQPPLAEFSEATSMMPVLFTGEIFPGSAAAYRGQVLILEGGGWWP